MREEGTYHHNEKLTKEMPGFLSPGKGVTLLLIPEYAGINKDQRFPDRSKTAHRKPPVKCILTVHGILQARILEEVDIPFSRGSSQPRDRTQASCIAGRFFAV